MGGRVGVARGTAFGVVAQAWQLLTAFVLYHYLSTVLGPAGFGQWRVALSVLLYFEIVVDTGLVKAATKRIAESPENSPLIERAAYLGQAVLAVLSFIVAQVAAGPISVALREPSLEPLLRIAAIDIPLVSAFAIASAILLGHHRFGRHSLGMLAYSTAKFVAIGLLVWRGFSVPGALVGNALASLVGFAVVAGLWQRANLKLGEVRAETLGMGRLAVPFAAQTLISGFENGLGLWFVQAVSGSVAAGLFGAAAAVADIPIFLFDGLSRVLLPSVASVSVGDEASLITRYASQGIRLALAVTVLGIGVMAATGEQLLRFIFTPAFAGAAVPLAILMVAASGRIIRAICSDVLMARDRRRSVLVILSVATAVEVALMYLAVSRFGAVGAACAAAAVALATGAASIYVLRAFVAARVVVTLVRSCAAAALVAIALAVVQPAGAWLVPAYAAAGTAYVLLLALAGEFDGDDVASMRAAFRG